MLETSRPRQFWKFANGIITIKIGIFIESVYVAPKVAVSEKTECAGKLDRIIESSRCNVRLSNHGDTCHASAGKSALHGGKCYRLVSAHHFCLLVTGWNGNKNGRDKPNQDSRAKIQLSLVSVEPSQGIKSSHCCNYKRARH